MVLIELADIVNLLWIAFGIFISAMLVSIALWAINAGQIKDPGHDRKLLVKNTRPDQPELFKGKEKERIFDCENAR